MQTTTLVLKATALKAAGIPVPFHALSPSTFPGDPSLVEKLLEVVTNFETVNRNGYGFYLLGPPDAGKTFLLTYLARLALFALYEVRYHTLSSLFAEYMAYLEAKVPFERHFAENDIVLIDNLGPPTGQGEVNALRRALTYMKDNQMMFALAGTLTIPEMRSLYGDDVAGMIEAHAAVLHVSKPAGGKDPITQRWAGREQFYGH